MQIKINEYDTIETGRYNGKWQIRVGYLNKNGEFKPHFQSIKKKDGSQINVPVSLTFDSDDDRKNFIDLCCNELGYKCTDPDPDPQPPAQDDVPF